MKKIASYYIDNRQIANGEFGGGLLDDGRDLTNMWPGMAFLGIDPDKLLKSLLLQMSAYYDQDRPSNESGLKQRSLPLFTNGLATIFTDELHSLEEGIQVVAQCMLLDYGNPLHIERGMETASRMLNDITHKLMKKVIVTSDQDFTAEHELPENIHGSGPLIIPITSSSLHICLPAITATRSL